MNWKVCAVSLLGLAFGISAPGQEHGGLILEAGDAITIGNFTYQDAKVDMENTFFNPQGSVEYYFPGRWFSLGAQYAQSKNGYDLAYTKGKSTWMARWMSREHPSCPTCVSVKGSSSTCASA